VRTTSATVVKPVCLISSAVNTVTGDSLSSDVRRSNEPVTTISLNSEFGAAAGGAVCADACDMRPNANTAAVTVGQRIALTAAEVLGDPDIKIAPSLNQTCPRSMPRARKYVYLALKVVFPLELLFRNVKTESRCANHTIEYGNFHPWKLNFFEAFAVFTFLDKSLETGK
jgi:hypothetical protein